MILLDVYTRGITIGLGTPDQAMFAIAFFIFVICCIPFLVRRR